MPDLKDQIRVYYEATSEPVDIDAITVDPGTVLVGPFPDAAQRRAALKTIPPQTQPEEIQPKTPWWKAPIAAAAAFAVAVVGIGIGVLLLTGDDGGDVAGVPASTATSVAPPTTAPPAPTTAPPPPTTAVAFAASIAEAGLPTEWSFVDGVTSQGLQFQATEAGEGYVLDHSFRIGSEELSAEGTASQAVELVQGSAVECLGRTYDQESLWTATPRGTGELNFGDAGSVTLAFDAVAVASNDAQVFPKVCAEWSGTYTGVSGNLANASGTFTVVFPTQSLGEPWVWTFDS